MHDLSQASRVANGVGAAEGFHSFQLSKRNLFIENFLSQNLVQKINSPHLRWFVELMYIFC